MIVQLYVKLASMYVFSLSIFYTVFYKYDLW